MISGEQSTDQTSPAIHVLGRTYQQWQHDRDHNPCPANKQWPQALYVQRDDGAIARYVLEVGEHR